MRLSTPITKQLDAVWALGNNQGGKDSAAALADGTYFVWLIGKSTTSDRDILLSASATSPNMPSGWDMKRLLLPIVRVGGVIKPFKQDGDQVTWLTPVKDVNGVTNPGTSAVMRTLTVPFGIRVIALLKMTLNNTNTACAGIATDPAAADIVPDSGNADVFTNAVSGVATLDTQNLQLFTNQSAQVRSRLSASNSNTILFITTTGFIFARGR